MEKIIIKSIGVAFILLSILQWFIYGNIYNIIVSTISSIVLWLLGTLILLAKIE